MDVIEAIKVRRSVRAFQPRELSGEVVSELIDCALSAPSAGNRQPWFIYVIQNPALKKELVDASYGQSFLAEAPVVFVVCADPARSGARYGARGTTLYCIQDTAALVQNLMLTAASMGLGTCWMGAFDESKVAEAIDCPEDLRPVAMVPVGHPAENPKPPKKRSTDKVVKFIS